MDTSVLIMAVDSCTDCSADPFVFDHLVGRLTSIVLTRIHLRCLISCTNCGRSAGFVARYVMSILVLQSS